MIRFILQASLANRFVVLAAAAVLLAWGAYETARMPVDVFPDLTAPSVTVVTEAHGMAPTEVEMLITFPIETALNGASGVRRVRSVSEVGISIIIVEFDWGTDIYRARQIVAEKLQLARSSLPPDVEPPMLAPVASIMGEIMFIALTSSKHDGMALRTAADWQVRRRVLAVPGVAEVIAIGGDTRQFQVVAQPDRLAAHGVTLEELIRALRAGNTNASAGFYVESGQEYLIQGLGRVRELADIGETVVKLRAGIPVLVRHVADVSIGAAPKRGTGAHSGAPAVVLGIQKQPGVNTLALTRRLDEVFREIQSTLPAGMTVQTKVFRQADFIGTSIDNLLVTLRDGAILVVLIVFAFLISVRATLVTMLALPLSLVTAVLVMKALGATINTMTLGGLAIALGALVDDAIIVVENIVRRLREQMRSGTGADVIGVVRDATYEIQGSIVYATLIILLVFLPLFFLQGVEGRLMVPLGLSYVVALAASLVVAVTVTPVLASLALPNARTVRRAEEPGLTRWLKATYGRILGATIVWWKTIALFCAILLALAFISLYNAGRAFLPDFNEGSLTVSVVTLPGTSLEESDRIGQWVERILLSHPEVIASARRTGRAERDPHAQAIHASEIDVALGMKNRSKEAMLTAMRRDFAIVPGTNVVIGQPISHRIDHLLSGTRANIAVKVFGPDLYELRRIATQVKVLAERVTGAVDVAMEQQTDIPQISVRLRRDAIARHGLTVAEVAEAVEAVFLGKTVSRVLERDASFDLVVRYPASAKESVEAMRATLLITSSGARVPLHALADVQKDRVPNLVSRENVLRKIVVMANVAGRDLGGVVGDIRAAVEREVKLPNGYHVEYGGQFKSAEEASRTLLVIGSAVVAGIFALLWLAFRSGRDATLVMLNLPLALIGGVVGLRLSGNVLSVASIIGFITLFGIATRNGVMLIAHIRHLLEQEGIRDLRVAVRRGAEERLVPILMTALAAGLALVPLALSAGQPGSEIQAPMAIVILFGLASSIVLNMIVVPAFYLRFGAIRAEIADGRTPRRRSSTA